MRSTVSMSEEPNLSFTTLGTCNLVMSMTSVLSLASVRPTLVHKSLAILSDLGRGLFVLDNGTRDGQIVCEGGCSDHWHVVESLEQPVVYQVPQEWSEDGSLRNSRRHLVLHRAVLVAHDDLPSR